MQAKKPSVAKLKKKADQVWSQYVRLRDSSPNGFGDCISCGVTKPWKEAQCGHFVSRNCSLLRYNEQNTNLQCVGCNMFKQGNQYAYAKGLDLKYGDGTADRLHSQRFTTHKWTVTELEQIIQDSKEQIKFYQSQGL